MILLSYFITLLNTVWTLYPYAVVVWMFVPPTMLMLTYTTWPKVCGPLKMAPIYNVEQCYSKTLCWNSLHSSGVCLSSGFETWLQEFAPFQPQETYWGWVIRSVWQGGVGWGCDQKNQSSCSTPTCEKWSLYRCGFLCEDTLMLKQESEAHYCQMSFYAVALKFPITENKGLRTNHEKNLASKEHKRMSRNFWPDSIL